LLAPHLVAEDLPLRRRLEIPNKKIEHVAFVERGMASIVLKIGHKTGEIGVVGCEGMTGLPVVLHADKGPHETFMQLAGSGLLIPADALRAAMDASPTLTRHFCRFAYVYALQISHTALTNGQFNIVARLSRWLLMVNDRVDGNEINITHEFLAYMLGVRRAGVTEVIHQLEARGLISKQRSSITIVDREKLIETALGSYGRPEAEYERLFKPTQEVNALLL
jgi:DNA-binding MarR family transcriptional regulator